MQTPGGIATDPILQPPPYNGQPLEVTIGLHIVNIAAIDEVSEQFQLDAYMFERWKDPRLAYSPEGPQDQVRNYAFGQIWIPQLEMINAATPRQRDEVSIMVSPDGTVRYAERLLVTLSSSFELRRFPFDEQRLMVIIHPFLVDGPHIKFKLSNTSTWTATEFKSYSSLAQWHLISMTSKLLVAPTYGGLTMPEARFEIDVKRRSSFYIWKVFLPLLLMVFLSWAVFWIEASDLSNQITGRSHHDSDGHRIRVCNLRDDAAPALPDVHRCVLPRMLHLRLPGGGRVNDGPRDASIGTAPRPGVANTQVLALCDPGGVRGDQHLNRGTFPGTVKTRLSTAACWALGGATIALAAIAELAMGRKIWGVSGEPGIWAGDVNSSHNSQYMTDPYSFSHITHGMLFYALTWLFFRNLPVRARALIALAVEAAWEIVETPTWSSSAIGRRRSHCTTTATA